MKGRYIYIYMYIYEYIRCEMKCHINSLQPNLKVFGKIDEDPFSGPSDSVRLTV